MPKKYGVKEKDLVVAHVINLILTGKLRSGDRIDRNEIAQELGLSRVPIQEAVVQLEHDGILSTRYHRGAYVERFDQSVVREHHEVYGMLNGIVAARAASARDPVFLGELEASMTIMRNNSEARAFQEAGWQFRTALIDQYAGPRLFALIRASQAFVPRAFWISYLHNYEEMLAHFEAEFDAIQRGDPDAARAVNTARADMMARVLLAELVRRGVFAPAVVAL
jgi:DNA-binding GntR family transcriptional regulator